MTASFRSWLPADAVAPPLAQGAVADMADSWSHAWFMGEPLRVLGAFARLGETSGDLRKTHWHVCDGGLAIGVSPNGIAALGAHVLGLPATATERAPVDLELLARVGGECLDDLKHRAAELLGLERRAAWHQTEGGGRKGAGDVHRLDISTPSRSLILTLELTADLFARFVKAKLPDPPARERLSDALRALAPQSVRLSAILGRCGLTVAELSGLAEGDVLVLDRAVDARLPLAVEGVEARRGSCILSGHGETVTLEITEALSG